MRLDGGNTENIVKALIKLTLEYPGKKIVVVWDNASYHSSKELNMKLEEIENLKRIQFTYLPPYSPDKNPIEHVWKVILGVSWVISGRRYDDGPPPWGIMGVKETSP